MMQKSIPDDPKGLVYEAYRIDGITEPECRTIFLDWALSLDLAYDTPAALRRLLEIYGTDPAHPMSQVMAQGLHAMAAPRRRGGWRSRKRD
jgi:hypothetical protein